MRRVRILPQMKVPDRADGPRAAPRRAANKVRGEWRIWFELDRIGAARERARLSRRNAATSRTGSRSSAQRRRQDRKEEENPYAVEIPSVSRETPHRREIWRARSRGGRISSGGFSPITLLCHATPRKWPRLRSFWPWRPGQQPFTSPAPLLLAPRTCGAARPASAPTAD